MAAPTTAPSRTSSHEAGGAVPAPLRRAADVTWQAVRRASAPVRAVAGTVTLTGWVCLGLLAATSLAGGLAGWQEALSAAAVLGVLVATSWLWLLPRGGHETSHEVLSSHITVGDDAAVFLTVRNPTSRRLLPTRMEITVGPGSAAFTVPTLAPGAKDERGFVLPTERRGVVGVGPVVSVSADPVGLLRRERARTQCQLVYIHPHTVRVDGSLYGLMRDVEGAVTQELSSSEVSFHALRDYVPGDDRRNVHWRTTARTGRLVVRQFEETRRSQLLVVLDVNASSYDSAQAFETAVSAACSVALAALRAGRQVRLVTQAQELPTSSATQLLDASCLVELGQVGPCDELVRESCARHPETSVLVLVTGQDLQEDVVAHVRTVTPVSIAALTLRCGSGALTRRTVQDMWVLDIDRADVLPRVGRML